MSTHLFSAVFVSMVGLSVLMLIASSTFFTYSTILYDMSHFPYAIMCNFTVGVLMMFSAQIYKYWNKFFLNK